ncbi:mycothiol acetyltransferase [Clostridium magnum DSM 2767]|uniref:Mycothiol acetyltransferase n=1 Tax=Clostridium magnum DSM 2767 TaxID=1121326 RepID=A0A161WZB9_9CLOT|nr:mycothiol acetyltransferase [Clostridium magnum DSM 2767]SHI26374.1 Acetyltransferase (GNAT) family protein [Clostridium magnum DSM 2767]
MSSAYERSGKIVKISVKRVTKEDVKIISNIYALSWKTAYRGLIPQKYLDELRDDFWVGTFENWITTKVITADILSVDNFPVGGIAYGKSRDEKLTDWGEIVSIYVHPDHYRLGYGKILLDTALKFMREDGYKKCYLWVLEQNENAKCFYEKNGFRCNKDQFEFQIMGKQLTDLRYVLDLDN